MEIAGKRLFVCNCEGTMALDRRALGRACGGDLHVHSALCRAELGNIEAAAAEGGALLVCCTQEAPLFLETAAQADSGAEVSFVNIRERAGWSDEGGRATAKIAALLAEAAIDVPPARSLTLTSEGRALVYGRDETAIEAARRLAGRLDATVLLTRPDEVAPPATTDVPLFSGTITAATGHFGAFTVTVDGFATAIPSARSRLEFGPGRNGVALEFDLIIDLSGGTALFAAPDKRDGYFNPDPGHPAALEKALFDATDLVGEFDKPIYVEYDEMLCAHARSNITGCTRCLDICPTSAIAPDGDKVAIDTGVCAGCGGCASVCPTGAASYAMPAGEILFQRLRTLLRAYREAGGADPVLLVHDTGHGADMIGAMARFGRGLPARVLPFAVGEITQIGFDFLTAALAYGADRLMILAGPRNRDDRAGLEEQIGFAATALDGLGHGVDRIAIVDEADPDALADLLYGLTPAAAIPPADFLPMGGKRTVAMLALAHLHDAAPAPVDFLELPAGAPFGAVEAAAGCTLCLACVGACPTGALLDNPDAPMLRFAERACIQCGLCRNTCPESVITLAPRFNFTGDAQREITLREEAPFACVSCGKAFGTRSSIERMVERLADHSMFRDDPAALERLKMCEDCRVMDQFSDAQPMAYGTPRRVRTTDDYLEGGLTGDEDD